jgi:hypothetical protein
MEGELFDSSTQQSFGVAIVTTRHINSTAKLVPPLTGLNCVPIG